MNDSYAVLDYNRKFFNVGDYIQSLAIIDNLKRVGVKNKKRMLFVNRENLSHCNKKNRRVIMQGWFAHDCGFIPSEKLDPLYIGFHLIEKYATSDILSKIVGHNGGKIGCRDLHTLKCFGERSYLSRCLTLTFDKADRPTDPQEIIVACYAKCGHADEFLNHLPDSIRDKAIFLKHRTASLAKPSIEENLYFAKSRLERYSQAKLVVTNLLHCALPCVAMGVPVVFINDFGDDIRARGTALAGVLPRIGIGDLKNLDYNSIPVVNVEKLKTAMKENFRLSFSQAFGDGEFKEQESLEDAREEIRAFISDEYYDFL